MTHLMGPKYRQPVMFNRRSTHPIQFVSNTKHTQRYPFQITELLSLTTYHIRGSISLYARARTLIVDVMCTFDISTE